MGETEDRNPTCELEVVWSSTYPGMLSLRFPGESGGRALRRAVKAAGFRPGDRVVVTLKREGE